MKIPVDYSNESSLRAAFSWITRTGAGVKFGSRPIGWYQEHQVNALDELTRICAGPDGSKVRCRGGMFEYQMNGSRHWNTAISAAELYRFADNKSRKG